MQKFVWKNVTVINGILHKSSCFLLLFLAVHYWSQPAEQCCLKLFLLSSTHGFGTTSLSLVHNIDFFYDYVLPVITLAILVSALSFISERWVKQLQPETEHLVQIRLNWDNVSPLPLWAWSQNPLLCNRHDDTAERCHFCSDIEGNDKNISRSSTSHVL